MIEGEEGARGARTATASRRPRLGRRVGVVLATAVALAVTTVTPAGAVYYSGGMSSRTFCVQNPSVNPTWLSAINAGRNAWNNHASFPGNISVFSGCTSWLEVGSYGDTWLGLYSPLITGSQYRIRLDSANLNSHINANGYAFANVVRSTTAHEFGHALRLGDHTNLPTRLMSGSRNRNSVISPTTAEVNESNGYY
ncbi:hypothetical protein [Cellulomonas sp. Y8]|uniref:hypothetical protein n=1 Tax=Cellulomonas sp. Y8 TaxID=2591145 RepID=UPI0011C70723|nr:hypothetical protein [Cellulomonas sp. Y8]